MIPGEPTAEHRTVAAAFSERVRGVAEDGWDEPAPVAGGSDVRLSPGPSVDDDPVAAWEHHAAAVQEVLDDPANATTTFAHPRLPAMPLPQAVSRFYTNDVFMHTWDLARATGQDDRLDPDRCRELYEGMLPIEEMLRESGQYGARVPVAEGADWQTKLLGFIGRDPEWSPGAAG